jgi:hypothetical protein
MVMDNDIFQKSLWLLRELEMTPGMYTKTKRPPKVTGM